MTFKKTCIAIVLLLLVSSASVFAETRRGKPDNKNAQVKYAGLTDTQVQERLNFIVNRLNNTEKWSQAWRYGWIAMYSSLAIVQGGLTFADDDVNWKEDMIVGSVTALFGLAGKLIFDFEPAVAPAKLRAMPESTPEERKEKLLVAENLFMICAQQEYDGWAWLTHMLNFSVNFTAGMVIWLGCERTWIDGLTTFAVGYAISLLDIFTQPTNAVRDRREYLKKFGIIETSDNDEPEFFFALQPMGATAGIRF